MDCGRDVGIVIDKCVEQRPAVVRDPAIEQVVEMLLITRHRDFLVARIERRRVAFAPFGASTFREQDLGDAVGECHDYPNLEIRSAPLPRRLSFAPLPTIAPAQAIDTSVVSLFREYACSFTRRASMFSAIEWK